MINLTARCFLTCTFVSATLTTLVVAKDAAYTRPKEAKQGDPDFMIQGEYEGKIGDNKEVGVQLVALGNGKFMAKAFLGGLPMSPESKALPPIESAKKEDGSITFVSTEGTAIYRNNRITVLHDEKPIGEISRVVRKSETLGKKPPEGAIVLFDGTNTDQWENALLDRKLLAFDPARNGATSKRRFGNHSVHIEFRLPYMPEARGQSRGNSGIYLQGRYEVQMLDSFGLTGEENECGGIYSISKPKLNMCYPPLTWQTYDIDFTAAKYNADGTVRSQPRVTVRHNGVLIHSDLELPHSTTASPSQPGPEDGPIYLQNHGNPVRYRNIWVVANEE